MAIGTKGVVTPCFFCMQPYAHVIEHWMRRSLAFAGGLEQEPMLWRKLNICDSCFHLQIGFYKYDRVGCAICHCNMDDIKHYFIIWYKEISKHSTRIVFCNNCWQDNAWEGCGVW